MPKRLPTLNCAISNLIAYSFFGRQKIESEAMSVTEKKADIPSGLANGIFRKVCYQSKLPVFRSRHSRQYGEWGKSTLCRH